MTFKAKVPESKSAPTEELPAEFMLHLKVVGRNTAKVYQCRKAAHIECRLSTSHGKWRIIPQLTGVRTLPEILSAVQTTRLSPCRYRTLLFHNMWFCLIHPKQFLWGGMLCVMCMCKCLIESVYMCCLCQRKTRTNEDDSKCTHILRIRKQK